MQPEAEQERNWREAAEYAPLLGVDPSLLAWEWLRRNPVYRDAAQRALGTGGRNGRSSTAEEPPEHWGLHRFELPDLPAHLARPIWHSSVLPDVLVVRARAGGDAAERFDLERFRSLATVVTGSDGEHVLLCDGLRAIRLDVAEGSILHGTVQLQYRISGIASAEGPLLSLRRLLALCRRGAFSAQLHGTGTAAARHVLMLRAHDGASDGATQREIAAELFGGRARDPRWRVREPSIRSRVQRLVRGGNMMAEGGYLALLRG